jgi:hypothetical protein
MPWPQALNEQPAITRWTTEPKSKRDSDALTNDENGKRNGDKPRPVENEHSNDAREKKCEPATRPNNEPRLGVEAPGNRLLNGVHWI